MANSKQSNSGLGSHVTVVFDPLPLRRAAFQALTQSALPVSLVRSSDESIAEGFSSQEFDLAVVILQDISELADVKIQAAGNSREVIAILMDDGAPVAQAMPGIGLVTFLNGAIDVDTFAKALESRTSVCHPQRIMPVLSPRQIEIFQHVKSGASNKEIAYSVGLSEGTVKGHVRTLLSLTGSRNRTELALGKLPPPTLQNGSN